MMGESDNFGGLILIGGKSSRMGQDKAALSWHGMRFLDHAKKTLKTAGAAPIVTSGGTGGLPDKTSGMGPMAGICALYQYVKAEQGPKNWVILPIDMPRLSADMLNRLKDHEGACVHYTNWPLPLYIRFDRIAPRVFDDVETRLSEGMGQSVHAFIKAAGGQGVSPAKWEEDALFNVNTPQDYKALRNTHGIER